MPLWVDMSLDLASVKDTFIGPMTPLLKSHKDFSTLLF